MIAIATRILALFFGSKVENQWNLSLPYRVNISTSYLHGAIDN
jgi:hypothetical protein